MTRLKAVTIHLVFSIIVIVLFLFIVYFIWYPKPFFEISKVIEPIKLLIMIDVVLGPLLTLLVYKKGKKSLKLDLSLIVAFQIAALIYGGYTIYQGRPNMIVFTAGKFYYLTEKYANVDKIKIPELKPKLFSKPKYSYVQQLSSAEVYDSYELMTQVDNYQLQLYPHSMNTENMLAKFNDKQEQINQIVSQYKEHEIAFFMLDKNTSNFYVIYSINSGIIIDYLQF